MENFVCLNRFGGQNILPPVASKIAIRLGFYLLVILLPFIDSNANAQNPLVGKQRLVLNEKAVSLDHGTILLGNRQQMPLVELGKGHFQYSEIGFGEAEIDFVYTAGRNGDSVATSSQSYLSYQASYHQLGIDRNIIRIVADGCPEYEYLQRGDVIELNRFTSQANQLQFESGTDKLIENEFTREVILDIEHHFQCKQFERLHVTIRTARSEYAANEFIKLKALQMDRVKAIKALFAKDSIVQIDQLQIETNLAYTAAQPTVSFEFHKQEGWLENDSIAFDILPMVGTNYAEMASETLQPAHISQIKLSDAQKQVLNQWSKEDWIAHLENASTDFASNLILYAYKEKDIPSWFSIGPMEWKLYGKSNDLVFWKAYLTSNLPKF